MSGRRSSLGLALACGALALAPTSLGCASTVLIPPEDATFARAQRRLESTEARVAPLGVPRDERVLFMQAEALYQYRYALPSRGITSSLVEFAAAVTDFPVLQSFAGSLDLLDVRLRSTDAAIQLWETLLVQKPRTALRPLTLYRLGWAYPNSDVLGLPRETGREAFAALIAEQPNTPLGTLAQEAERVPMKRKSTAAELSIVPGLGQFYVGRSGSGTIRLAIALAALAAVVAPVVVAYDRRADLTWHRDWPLLATSVAGILVLSFDYTASYEDAMRGVVEWNERAEQDFESRHPDAP
ncbi:MAG TPA: hypothetical protein VKZ18_17910 [Polyangia bacterium]|nr:hypothetical protein [Polyangia bacterium]